MSDGRYDGDGRYDELQDETVDDILAEILNSDGSFNSDFNNRFAAYLGEDATEFSSTVRYDLSDRRGEVISGKRVEYESPDYVAPGVDNEYDTRTNRRVDGKLPENVREAYYAAETDARRPEFTAGGAVRYPSLGVGAAEERVVFDADWEEKAKKEAARMQRVREDRMLRGDSTYVRSFVAGGRSFDDMRFRNEPASPYVDPLDDDDDIYSPEFSRGANDNRNSFFHSGSSVKENDTAAGGRTENTSMSGSRTVADEKLLDDLADSYEQARSAKSSWLEIEDKTSKKKKNKSKRNKNKRYSAIGDGEPAQAARPKEPEPEDDLYYGIDPLIDGTERLSSRRYTDEFDSDDTLTQPKRRRNDRKYTQEAVERAQTENTELKNTVADIIEKYNKRNKEDEIARAKAEEERIAREKELAEERKRIREGLSDTLIMALDEEDERPEEFSGYENFSDEQPEPYFAPAIGSRPKRKKAPGGEYVEKLDDGDGEVIAGGFDFDSEVGEKLSEKNGKRKKKR